MDGALNWLFAGTTAVQQVFRCDPATGAVTLRELPAVVGLASAPMARLGPLFYGACVNSRLWPRERPGGSLFQLAAAGATLPPLDSDGDALPNAWETAYGLDPFDGGHGSGAADDPDGDGRTNAQELADGTHPRGIVTRLFAEGATNAFFRTRFDLANVSLGDGALVRARFLTDTGATVAYRSRSCRRGATSASSRRRCRACRRAPSRRSSSRTTSIAVDRAMSWDASGYGSHLETGDCRAVDDVVLRRGLDLRGFSLFYLLQNPQTTAVDRDGALPAPVRRSRRSCAPTRCRQRAAPRSSSTRRAPTGEHGRLGGDHRDVRRSSRSGRCT